MQESSGFSIQCCAKVFSQASVLNVLLGKYVQKSIKICANVDGSTVYKATRSCVQF